MGLLTLGVVLSLVAPLQVPQELVIGWAEDQPVGSGLLQVDDYRGCGRSSPPFAILADGGCTKWMIGDSYKGAKFGLSSA